MYALYILGPAVRAPLRLLEVPGPVHGQRLCRCGGLFCAHGCAFVRGFHSCLWSSFAAQGVFFYQNQKVFGPRARAAFSSIVRLAIINFIIGLSPGIDNWGHFGGALGGVLIAWVGGPACTNWRAKRPDLRLKNQRDDGDFILALIATFILAAIAGRRLDLH